MDESGTRKLCSTSSAAGTITLTSRHGKAKFVKTSETDQKANEFIQTFRENLKVQRVNSLAATSSNTDDFELQITERSHQYLRKPRFDHVDVDKSEVQRVDSLAVVASKRVDSLAVVASKRVDSLAVPSSKIDNFKLQMTERSYQYLRKLRFDHADVDKSADDFINKFRKNLKIERKESLDNYNDMLKRGV